MSAKPEAQPVASSAGSFARGARAPFAGALFLLARPKLWLLVLIPLILNAILFAALLGGGHAWFSSFLEGWFGGENGDPGFWHGVLMWLARALFWVVALALVYLLFTPLALVIASPFNDRLAELAERARGHALQDDRSIMKALFQEAGWAVLCELKRLPLFLSVFLILLPLNLIPVLGSALYLVLSFLWACLAVSFEFTSYAADRRHLRFREKWRRLLRRPGLTFGFGAVMSLALAVPFLNTLVVPVGAVAGSMLFCDMAPDSDGPRTAAS